VLTDVGVNLMYEVDGKVYSLDL